jgi:transcriptional regulator with XRE-family HTH domain
MSAEDDYKTELAQYLQGLGANVRRLRNTNRPGLSQEELAYRARLHRTEVGKIEQGHVEPKLTTLVLIAEVLGVSLNELVQGLPVPAQRKPPSKQAAYRS